MPHGARLRQAGPARMLVITERSVSKHTGNIFAKLGPPPGEAGDRRVRAVLAYLEAGA